MDIVFKPAMRRKSKLRLALAGPSGSGKTYSALLVAKGLGGRTALVDTENGSAQLYSDVFNFDVLELGPPYTPERFVEAIEAAAEAGYNTLILDSVTHEWSGKGGCLELVDAIAAAKFRGNSWSAWNEVTPRHRAFIDAMLRAPMHIIATMRSKTETAQVEEGGRKRVVKLGMKVEQREGIEYEFAVLLDLVHDGHLAVATKDRTGLFVGRDPERLSEETGKRLRDWLESGTDPQPEPEGMRPADYDLHMLAMSEAKTIEALAEAYTAAYKAARAAGDMQALQRFTEKKDSLKQALKGENHEAV